VTAREHKRGIRIFRAADSVGLYETDFMYDSEDSAGIPEDVLAGVGDKAGMGSVVKVLVRDAGGFSLVHAWFKGGFDLPRHSHSTDCMYYVISGSAILGSQVLRAGDSFFVPANAPYGYKSGFDGVEVLEIRYGTQTFDIKLYEASPERWKAFADTVAANSHAWSDADISPTFAANGRESTPSN
jgi:quercetin dioxygenase-like cupin family protein